MSFKLSQKFTVIFILYFATILNILFLNISVHATFRNSSEEIKNIFSSLNTKSVLQGTVATGYFMEGELIHGNFTQIKSNTFSKNGAKNLSDNHDSVFAFKDLLNKKNLSLPFKNETININYNSHQNSSTKNLLLTKLLEKKSNLFLGVPEIIHINGISSIKPRKGVYYNKIVPRKGVDYENEAFHVSLENHSCFWLGEKECYSDKGTHCKCCKEGNAIGKNVKQASIPCKGCKTFIKLSSAGNEACESICCNTISSHFDSMTSSENIYNGSLNYLAVSSNEKQLNTPLAKMYDIISNGSSRLIEKKGNHNLTGIEKYSKFKPLITKVPYDEENTMDLFGKAQEKFVVPLTVSLFLMPFLGIIIFLLWHRTKEYLNRRYYKRMDFLIDGIYND